MKYLTPPAGTLTTTLAALAAGVQPATICDWVRRGILTRCGGNSQSIAKARFSTSEHEVTDAEAEAINTALKATLCA